MVANFLGNLVTTVINAHSPTNTEREDVVEMILKAPFQRYRDTMH